MHSLQLSLIATSSLAITSLVTASPQPEPTADDKSKKDLELYQSVLNSDWLKIDSPDSNNLYQQLLS